MFRKVSILVALAIFGLAMSFPTDSDSDTSETYENYPDGIRNDDETAVNIETPGSESHETKAEGSYILIDLKHEVVKVLDDDSRELKTIGVKSTQGPAGGLRDLGTIVGSIGKCATILVDINNIKPDDIASCLGDLSTSLLSQFIS